MILYKANMIDRERDPVICVSTPLYTSKEECIKHAEHLLNTCTSPDYDDSDEYGRIVEVPDFLGYVVREVSVYTHFDESNK